MNSLYAGEATGKGRFPYKIFKVKFTGRSAPEIRHEAPNRGLHESFALLPELLPLLPFDLFSKFDFTLFSFLRLLSVLGHADSSEGFPNSPGNIQEVSIPVTVPR